MSSKQLNKPEDHISFPGPKAVAVTPVVTTLGWMVITCGWIIAIATVERTQRKRKMIRE